IVLGKIITECTEKPPEAPVLPKDGNTASSGTGSTSSQTPLPSQPSPTGSLPSASPGVPLTPEPAKQEASDRETETLSQGKDLPNEVATNGGNTNGGTPPPNAPETANTPNIILVKSALLKDYNGVKITGPCKAKFHLFLVPHITIEVETENNKIILKSKLDELKKKKKGQSIDQDLNKNLEFEKNKDNLKNTCTNGKTFKFVVYTEGNTLTLKWMVYDTENAASTKKNVDMRKYLMKNLDRPITAIQVYSSEANAKTFLVESKGYSIKSNMPEMCELIAINCFLSGNIDIDKCYQCTLLTENADKNNECFKYVSSEVKDKFNEIKAKGQDDENPTHIELTQVIDNILKKMYKMDENNNMQLIIFEGLDDKLKSELINYCKLIKEIDTSGALENYEMGNETDIFNNLTTLLQTHAEETYSSLQHKLTNAAICMKDVNDWIKNKTGLILPVLSYNTIENQGNPLSSEQSEVEDNKTGTENTENGNYDGVINLVSLEESNVNTSHVTDTMYCNEDYCDRWKDKNSCVSKIEAKDQGNCATSWIFASKVHLETIRCMKGYDHASISALYVANCANKEAMDKCHVGSNPLEFLKIIYENKFLPLEVNLPYSYTNVGNACPNPQNHWTNLWANVELLDSKDEPNSLGAKGYTAYESDKFKGNMDAFINIIKHEIMHKGSVIAYVKAKSVMGYNLNGKKVLNVCGDKNPDHAVNIIGWGNYINIEGNEKPYWIVKNSWGKYWGDDGNFKVDMHGSEQCEHNFIHSVAIFNIDMPMDEVTAEKDAGLYNYFLKTSPDFYNNLYNKNFNQEIYNDSYNEKALAGNSEIYGSEEAAEASQLAGAAASPEKEEVPPKNTEEALSTTQPRASTAASGEQTLSPTPVSP
ncbi:serine-repeat antigen, putative, partial [Plasmodium malariae]